MMENRTIAWIEDDADEIAAVIKPLQRAGFHFNYYRDYSEAIEKREEIRQCDLILLDLIIPPGSASVATNPELRTEQNLGKKLLRRFREEFAIEQPAIALSMLADTDGFEEGEAEELKVVQLPKPIRPAELKAAVYRVLRLEDE